MDLPDDILLLLPLTDHHRAAACTCRRLRALSLSSVTKARLACTRPGAWKAECMHTLQLLPNLKELRVCGIAPSDPLPQLPHLTVLDLRLHRGSFGSSRLDQAPAHTSAQPAANQTQQQTLSPLVASMLRFHTTLQTLLMPRLALTACDARALALDLRQLRQLDLSHNELREKGARALRSLTSLVDLALASNRLGPLGAWALVSLANLKALNLSDNQLAAASMPAIAQLSALTRLDVSRNCEVRHVLRALTALTSLEFLSLRHNELTGQHITSLHGAPAPRALDLRGNSSFGRSGILALAALTGLQALGLRDCGNAGGGMEQLSALPGLTRLAADNLSLTYWDVRALTRATSLRALSLSGNQLGDKSVAQQTALTALQELSLAGTGMTAVSLPALTKLGGLLDFDLSGNDISTRGAEQLARMTALQKLELSGARIRAWGVNALTSLTGLTYLGLSDNDVRASAAAYALTTLSGLQHLSLRNSRLCDEGVCVIAGMASLRSLDLVNNGIGDKGAKWLARMAELETLFLGWNATGAEALQALLRMHASVDFKSGVRPFVQVCAHRMQCAIDCARNAVAVVLIGFVVMSLA